MSQPDFALPADAELTTTASGLRHATVREGTGKSPGPRDRVTVHYSGWLLDGTVFDSSYQRGQTIAFRLDEVIAGWTEGVQLMREGGVAKLVIPPNLAYGRRGAPPVIGPDATLLFQVELIRIG
ncbi:MAG: FKBP-type peptidyl-prolyl cis-trans isomerase [Candidatus Binatia bacterium]